VTMVVRPSFKVWATQCIGSYLCLLDSDVVINVNGHVVHVISAKGERCKLRVL